MSSALWSPEDDEVELPDPQRAALQVLAGQGQRAITPSQERPFDDAPGSTLNNHAMGPLPQQPGTPAQYQSQQQQAFVDAPTTQAAYKQLPSSAAPQQVPNERPFNWGRALTAFGGGDVGAYDAQHNRMEDAPQHQFAFGRQQADAAFEDQQRAQQQRLIEESMNPQSATSRAAQKQYRDSLNVLANSPGVPEATKAYLASQVDQVGGMTAAQVTKSQFSLQSLFGNVMKAAGVSQSAEKVAADEQYKAAMLNATVNNQQEGHQIQRAGLAQNDAHFQAELERKAAADALRAKSGRLRLQTKSVDKKAVEELQNIEAMKGQLGDVEQNLDKAITGPGVGVAMAAEGVANSSVGKAVGLDSVFNSLTPSGTREGLAATRTVQSGIEQAIAEMKLKRHGASFTANEQRVVDKWSPGVQLGKEDNAILASALRKYMASRGQQRILQVFKETGMPIEFPANKQLSMDDVSQLKALYEGIDKYSDEDAAGVADRVDEILVPYGGRVAASRQHAKPATTQVTPKDPKIARAEQIVADPNESPEKKAKAQKWLDVNRK